MGRETELIAQAKSAAGWEDFGPGEFADSFREGLERLVASIDSEANLNAFGLTAFNTQILDLLTNRLKVESWYARHPEIDEEEIVAPLICMGLPRTGSTALGCLLGEDPAFRSLRNWEAIAPTPPPDKATLATDPRIAAAEATMERRARLFPRMVSMVPSGANTATECQLFMGYDFKAQIFQAFARIPTYVEWLNHQADLVPTYRYVKRVLKLLQWRCPPNRWRLRNPSHSLFIGALGTVFPDARFVMTHREVTAVIPSVADLYFELHKAYSDAVDTLSIGRETADFCELGMRRMIAFRDAGNEDRFFDVDFAAFQADPFGVIEKLYASQGDTLSAEGRAAMEAWRASKPRDPSYERSDMALFGLDADQLRARFTFYAERYGVPATAG